MNRCVLLFCVLALTSVSCGPFWARITIRTDPAGAEVQYNNGENTLTSPGSLTWGPKDSSECFSYGVSLKKDGYSDSDQSFTVCPKYKTQEEAEANTQEVVLAMKAKYFRSFLVDTEPSGAHVYGENGVYWGKSPTKRVWFSDSATCLSYTVTAKMAGYEDTQQTWQICPKYRSEAVSFENIEPAMIILNGRSGTSFVTEVLVTSDPEGASVYGDGRFWGITPYSNSVRWPSSTSTINLRIEKAGWTSEVEMLSPGVDVVHVVLQPSNAAPR